MKDHAVSRRIFRVFCIIWLSVAAMPVFAQAEADMKIEQGRLKLIGKGIEHLVLVDKDGKRHEFNTPGEILSLPPGEYRSERSEQVRLTGGFSCNVYWPASGYSFTIDPNSTTELRMGAPLTQTITVSRKGQILQLGYELRGIGGEEYTGSDSRYSNPPEFAVYKGDKKVGGGKFEFGRGVTCSYSWRVPPHVYGDLKFVAMNDLGDLGSKESDPVTYTWRFIDNLPGLIVWVAVLIAFVLFRENWTPKAFLILLPMFVVSVVWLGLKKVTGMRSGSAVMFDIISNSFVAGIAALWLLAERIGNRNRPATFLLAVVVMAIMCALAVVSLGEFKISTDMERILAVFAVLAATALLAFVFTGWMCRKTYSAVRFMLWLAVWTVAPCLLLMMIIAAVSIIGALVMGNGPSPKSLLLMALMFPLAGLILGGLYAILFPFMILAFKSDLFRRRFYGCFRLKGMLAPAVAETEDFSDEGATDLI